MQAVSRNQQCFSKLSALCFLLCPFAWTCSTEVFVRMNATMKNKFTADLGKVQRGKKSISIKIDDISFTALRNPIDVFWDLKCWGEQLTPLTVAVLTRLQLCFSPLQESSEIADFPLGFKTATCKIRSSLLSVYKLMEMFSDRFIGSKGGETKGKTEVCIK